MYDVPMDHTAAWSDVKAKGRRLLADGRCTILRQSSYEILGIVEGDHDTYVTYVNNNLRINFHDNNEPSFWDCTCPWSEWAFSRETLTGRVCSHAYALHLLLQRTRRERRSSLEDIPRPLMDDLQQAIAENLEAFSLYVKEGVAPEAVTQTLIDIAVMYSLPLEEMDDIIESSLVDIIAGIQQNMANEAQSQIQQIQDGAEGEIERLDMLLPEEPDEEDSYEYIEELVQLVLEECPPEQLPQILQSPNTFLSDELDDEEAVIFRGLLAEQIMPEDEPSENMPKQAGFTKQAGRVFTEEEKLALINELGVARQFLAGEII